MLYLLAYILVIGSNITAMDEASLAAASAAASAAEKRYVKLCEASRTLLHNAIKNSLANTNNIPLDFVERLILEGAIIDALDNEGETALHYAVKSKANNNRECVQLLINNKAALEVKNKELATPLAIALENEREEIARELIRCGADVENTAYCSSATFFNSRNYQMARFIISEGENVNSHSGDTGGTPLHSAIYVLHNKNLEFLLEEGADPEIPDNNGRTALALAIEKKNESAVNIIKRYLRRRDAEASNSNIDKEDINKKLHRAVLKGDVNAVQDCIKQGANVNSCDFEGCRPLHHSASAGHTIICEILIDAGAYVSVKDRLGCTPLHYAVEGGHAPTSSLLLTRGASAHLRNNQGFTPLHCAAHGGDSEICLLLLKIKKMHEQKLTKEGCSALHLACEQGHLEVVKVLIEHKADTNAKNNTGWTPLHYAAFSGNPEICDYLLENNAEIDAQNEAGLTPLHCGVMRNYTSVACLLCEKGATVDLQNSYGDTALHLAAKNENTAMCDLLIERGAQTVMRNNQGATALVLIKDNDELYIKLLNCRPELTHIAIHGSLFPLHLAVNTGKLSLVGELLRRRASVYAKTDNGFTPLHLAAARADPGIVQELLNHKALVHAKTNDGITPLEAIMINEAPTFAQKKIVCELLLTHGASPVIGKPVGAYKWVFLSENNLVTDGYELLELFFRYGVNVVLKNKYGYCFLHSNEGGIRNLRSLEEDNSLHEGLYDWLATTRGKEVPAAIYRIILENTLCIPIMNNAEQRQLLRNRLLTSILCLKKVFSSQGFHKAEDLIFKILSSSNYFIHGIVTLLIAGLFQKEKWVFPRRVPKAPEVFQRALIQMLKKTTLEYIVQTVEDNQEVVSSHIMEDPTSIEKAIESSIREKCGYTTFA